MHDDKLNEPPKRVDAVTLYREKETKRGWVHWRLHAWTLARDLRAAAAHADDHCAIDTRFMTLRDLLNDAADALEAAPR